MINAIKQYIKMIMAESVFVSVLMFGFIGICLLEFNIIDKNTLVNMAVGVLIYLIILYIMAVVEERKLKV